LPHILEHLALCGSERFPVRDPFFLMLRRSLQTFMNAMTYPDFTCYPFSTCNEEDFFNLFSIYADAVFRPNLDRRDFDQEGWRLEPDADGNLQLAGIVFNEMKGAMGDSDAQCSQALSRLMLADTCYAVNSGGEPTAIPDLSYDDLVTFHRQHYTPANGVLVTYGAVDLDRLQTAAAMYCQGPTTAAIAGPRLQTRLPRAGQRHAIRVPCADDDAASRQDASLFGRYYLLGDFAAPAERMRAQLVDVLLTGHAAAPLRHSLEQANLARSASGTGLMTGYRNGVFAVELTGLLDEATALAELQPTLSDAWQRASEAAQDPEAIASALHRLELQSRRIENDSYGKGLLLALNSVKAWNVGCAPSDALDMPSHLSALRTWAETPGAILAWLETNLFGNNHWLEIVSDPDPTWVSQLDHWQVEQAQAIAARQERDHVAAAKALAERQAEADDDSCLPTIRVSDIAPTMTAPDGGWSGPGEALFSNTAGSNGLAELTLVQSLPELSQTELEHLPRLCALLGKLGTDDRSYLQQAAAVQKVSEGLQASYRLFRQPGSTTIEGMMTLRISGLERNVPAMCQEIARLFTGQRFDEEQRHDELLGQTVDYLSRSLVDRGHRLATSAAAAVVDPLAAWNDHLSGATALKRLRDSSAAVLSAPLRALWQKLAARPWRTCLVGEQANTAPVLDHLGAYLGQASPGIFPSIDLGADRRGIVLPQAIRFNARCWSLGTEANAIAVPELGRWQVALQALKDRFLHTKIREQGSAYGSMASLSSRTVCLTSYRDPRLDGTHADYEAALHLLADDAWSEQTIEQAILGVMADFDQPLAALSNAARSFTWSLSGLSLDSLQAQRQAILSTTKDDIQRLGRHLATCATGYATAADQAAMQESSQTWQAEQW
jgi:Zn-dependent M16 (insulinase) family peptidase